MNKKKKDYLYILESHKKIIFKVAHNYCFKEEDKDDLIQEIILQVWLSMDNFDNKHKWSTWIYRIALNTSISFYRKNKKREEKTISLAPAIEVQDLSIDDNVADDVILLNQFIRELRELDRALILLHLDGLTSREIAEVINISQTNVTTKISRIKTILKEKFNQIKK